MVRSLVEVAGLELAREGVDGGQCGTDVALGLRCRLASTLGREVLQQHQAFGILHCCFQLLRRERVVSGAGDLGFGREQERRRWAWTFELLVN